MTHRSNFRRSVSVLAAAIAVALSAHVASAVDSGKSEDKNDAKKYDLRYTLKRGEVLRYEISHRASVRSTIEQQTQAAQTVTDSVKAWKVTDVLKNGEIEFISVIEAVHMVNQLPDKDPTEYDSQRDSTPPPGFEDVARNIGVPLSQVRITPAGKVTRRDVKVKGAHSEDDAPIALRLPEEPVAIGDTWDESFDVVVGLEDGGTKSIQTRRHHELLSVEKGIATIKVTYQVLSPIDARIECQLVQRLMEGEVKFDIDAGYIVGQKMNVDKRILGFAGPTSSMQYVMRMEERLLKKGEKVDFKTAARPSAKSTSPEKPRTATRQGVQQRPRTKQGSRTTRR